MIALPRSRQEEEVSKVMVRRMRHFLRHLGRRLPIPDPEPATVAAGFAVAALLLWSSQPLMTDQGLVTADAGEQLLHGGADILFFQYLKPVAMLLALPVAGMGWQAFILAQILFTAVAIYLLGRTATTLHGTGWQAALVMATSPELLFATVTGVTNAMAVCLFVVALYVWVVHRRLFWTGVILGALPWCRFEYGVYALVLMLFALRKRSGWRLLVGAAVFPVFYLGAGAIYHHSMLWFIEYPPEVPLFPGAQELDLIRLTPRYLAFVLASIAIISPLWPFVFMRRWKRYTTEEKVLAICLGLAFLGLVLMPILRLLHFRHDPRYWVMFVPIIALLAGGQRTENWSRRGIWIPVLMAAGAAASVLAYPHAWALAGALPLVLPLALLILGRTRPRLLPASQGVLALALLAASASFARELPLDKNYVDEGTLSAGRWLRSLDASRAPEQVVTNVHLLNIVLEHTPGQTPQPHVRFLVQPDNVYIICRLADHDNGQYGAVVRTFRDISRLGSFTWPCELATLDLSKTLFVWRKDYRLDAAFGRNFWRDRAVQLEDFGDIGVWRLRSGAIIPTKVESAFPIDERCLTVCSRP